MAVGGEVIKVKLIKFINSLFVHFIIVVTSVSDSTTWSAQSSRPRPQSAVSLRRFLTLPASQ